jgi:hypothetical protein
MGITDIIEALVKYKSLIAYGIILIIIVASVFYVWNLKKDNTLLISQKALISSQLVDSQASIKTLQTSIDTQNAAFDALKSAADAQQVKNAAALKQAQIAAGNYKQRAEDLLKLKAPQNIPKCDAANDLINQELFNVK